MTLSTALAAGMIVDPACWGLLAELAAYTWKPERTSGESRDAPIKAPDDAGDALRYAVMAHALPDEPGILGSYRRLAAEAGAARFDG